MVIIPIVGGLGGCIDIYGADSNAASVSVSFALTVLAAAAAMFSCSLGIIRTANSTVQSLVSTLSIVGAFHIISLLVAKVIFLFQRRLW